MANNHELEHVSSGMDYREHERTYQSFMNLLKWSVAVIVVLMVVLYFIVQP